MDLFDKCYNFTRADEVKAAGFYPYFRAIEANEGPVVAIEGKEVIMAGSNNYLGLTTHPKVKEAIDKVLEASRKYDVAAGRWGGSVENVNKFIEQGYRFLPLYEDVDILTTVRKDLQRIKGR